MATFIKAGFWEKTCNPCNGYKGWLNLDQFINPSGTSGTSGTSGAQGPIGPQGVQGTQGIQGVTGANGTSGTSGEAGDKYRTTSTTSFTLGTSTTLIVGIGLAYTPAQDIIITYDVDNHQVCTVVSYDSITGVLVIGPPITVTGSGTYSSWTVNLEGAAGGDGSSGTSGLNGSSGTSGAQGPQGVQGIQGVAGTSGTSGSSGVSYPNTSYGLYAQTADSTPVTGTAVETTIIGTGVGTLTVPANSFSVGNSFLCALDGLLSCTSSSTVIIRIKTTTGVLLADTGIIDLAASTNKSWLINLYFTIRTLGTAGVASISSGGLFSYIRNGGTQFEGYVLSTVNSTTFDTTISNTLIITAQWDTDIIDNSILSRNFTLTKVY